MARKVLITGGKGFVGKHLQEELNLRGDDCFVFNKKECDLVNKDQTRALFESNRDASLVIHLACYQAAGDFPAKHTAEQFFVNNSIHLNVLEGWREFLSHAKLVAVGSSCGYPSRDFPLTEDRFMDGEIHGSVYSYAFTKRALYTGIRAYNDQYGLDGTYLIPPTLFGEHDDFHVETAHVCGALIAKFVGAVRENQPEVEIWGDGSQIREFLYVKDFVTAMLDLSEVCERDIINVGPGRGKTIKELANTIQEASEFAGKLFFNTDRYVGVKEKFLNADKLSQKYNMRLEGELAEGIKRTVAWAFDHYPDIKNRRKFG